MAGALTAMIGAGGGRLLTVGNNADQYGYVNGFAGDLTPREFLSSVIIMLEWQPNGGPGALVLGVANTSLPNSGWTSININGTTFLRTSAAFSVDGGGFVKWVWTVASNPIGTTIGAVIPVNIA